DAGIGCATGDIVVDKVIDDAAKVALQVQCVKWDLELGSDAAGVDRIGRAAAALLMIGASARRISNGHARHAGSGGSSSDTADFGGGFAVPQEDADHLVSGFKPQMGSDAGVDPAAHR